jgi:hypothetical protein
MIHSVRFIAVLDTNVIYPVIIRDLLFWFAYYDLYTPKWSDHIFDEWNFLTDIIDLNQKRAIAAFKEMVLNKKNPKQDEFEVLNRLRSAGLKDTANYLHALL